MCPKDCNAALGAEPARNPLVKGEGIVCLMIPLLLYQGLIKFIGQRQNFAFCSARWVIT